jgi:hypothetical protein
MRFNLRPSTQDSQRGAENFCDAVARFLKTRWYKAFRRAYAERDAGDVHETVQRGRFARPTAFLCLLPRNDPQLQMTLPS